VSGPPRMRGGIVNEEYAVEILEWLEAAAQDSSAERVLARMRSGAATVCQNMRFAFGHSINVPNYVQIEFVIPVQRILDLPGVAAADVDTVRELLPAITVPNVTVDLQTDLDTGEEAFRLQRTRPVAAGVASEIKALLHAAMRSKAPADFDRFRQRVIQAEEEGC
jgi:hypothetical protein